LIETVFPTHQAEAELMSVELDWLPVIEDWDQLLTKAQSLPWPEAKPLFVQLANSRLDFLQMVKLDRAVQRNLQTFADVARADAFRLAILGSSTLSQLTPGIRVGGLRRGLVIEVYEGPYGLYRQELHDPASGLHAFEPQALLLALDARHVVGSESSSVDQALTQMRDCWSLAKAAFNCAVIQQTLLPAFPPTLGNNEHRLAESPLTLVDRINEALRPAADAAGISLLAVDSLLRWHGGVEYWFDPGLWNRAKQEVSPRAVPLYGEQVGRLLAALRGLSAKCLVLDLDNTLWGGVIGDDGLEGIILGQGNATGEAFLEFQWFIKRLQRRGVILAVCSKNDEANALIPFQNHPEMVLKAEDIACFQANWSDKAQNIRTIAATLNIGLDSLVFVDDNPVERGLIRRELPMVAVPEMPEDPAEYVRCLARGGYFEAVSITQEDRARNAQYAANAEREKMRETITDMESYLAALKMDLIWQPFDEVSLPRNLQLANKTNQFNLTTIRYAERDLELAMEDPNVLTFQFRLKDVYGDNGIISLLLARLQGQDLFVETWLMSCRVLGRRVEDAVLHVLAARARARGARRIIGEYRQTAKNGMVRDHYAKLGFTSLDLTDTAHGRWALNVENYVPQPNAINIVEGPHAKTGNLQSA
jgi:FkbH-like protein